MKTFCFTTMIVVTLTLCSIGIQAQETITTSCGNVTGSGVTVSYSVGQVAYTSNTFAAGTVTQGAQQRYEILVVTKIEKANGFSLEFSVYPNPTSDSLMLRVESHKIESPPNSYIMSVVVTYSTVNCEHQNSYTDRKSSICGLLSENYQQPERN